MTLYECMVCGYVYDEAVEGVPWEELPEDWVCVVCFSDRSYFMERAAKEEEGPVAPASDRW